MERLEQDFSLVTGQMLEEASQSAESYQTDDGYDGRPSDYVGMLQQRAAENTIIVQA